MSEILLIKFAWPASADPTPALRDVLRTYEAAGASGFRLELYRGVEVDEGYGYASGDGDGDGALRAAIAAALPGAQLVGLRLLQDRAGASHGQPVCWHYVVETDVLPEMEADFNAWYDEEHLPGLAAVPGTVCAARYRTDAPDGPRYHACYGLETLATFGSPPWLAVRATDWSSRIRPAFRNTRRTMFRRVG